MNGLIIYNRESYEEGGEFVDQVQCLIKQDSNIVLCFDDEISFSIINGTDLVVQLSSEFVITSDDINSYPKWVIARTNNWEVIYALESIGLRCFPSSEYIRISSDKMLSHMCMRKCFKTFNSMFSSDKMEFKKFSFPSILKATSGHGGYSVYKVDTAKEIQSIIKDDTRTSFMLQSLAPTPDDLRVYILGGEIIGAVLRQAAKGEIKANLTHGGKGLEYKLSDKQRLKIQSALKNTFKKEMGFVSFDFLFDDDNNIVFNEMNCFPGISFLAKLNKADGFLENYINKIEVLIENE